MKFAIEIKRQLVYGMLACAIALALSNVSLAQRTLPVDLPAQCSQIQVPEGNTVAYRVYALGVQDYSWDATSSSWMQGGLIANLYANPNYQGIVGTHHGGPTWISNSGGLVTGVEEYECSPDPNSIPWQRVRADEVDGVGMFRDTTFVQRLKTSGGKAPVNPGEYDGQPANVPFTAEYLFYRAARGQVQP